VGPAGGGGDVVEGEMVTHKYYQWVCFTLFFQAMCFLAPYHLWKYWEAGMSFSTYRLIFPHVLPSHLPPLEVLGGR
jgi:Innexin